MLGMDGVPTIRLETLTQSQIRAYILADNQIAINAGWDKSILAVELEQLLAFNDEIDITLTGFEIPEIDLILQDAANANDPEDELPIEEAGPAVTQPGDPMAAWETSGAMRQFPAGKVATNFCCGESGRPSS
jgi:hypothetical protein